MKYFTPTDDCSHAGAHKEFISGQRTGEYVCEACGNSWTSEASLENAQDQYRRKKQLEEIAKLPASELSYDQLMIAPTNKVAESIQQRAYDQVADLINGNYISALMAKTNAFGWSLDTFDIDQDSIKISKSEISCTGNVQFAGEQDEDKADYGDIISGTVEIVIDSTMKIELVVKELDLEEN